MSGTANRLDVWTARELLNLGQCTAQCLLGRDPRRECAYICRGQHHGTLADAELPDRFAEMQLRALAVLPQCDRCERDRDEKCLDRGWDIDERAPVTCGCGCWRRRQLEDALEASPDMAP